MVTSSPTQPSDIDGIYQPLDSSRREISLLIFFQ